MVVYYSVYTHCETQYPENQQNSESLNQLFIFEIDVLRSGEGGLVLCSFYHEPLHSLIVKKFNNFAI